MNFRQTTVDDDPEINLIPLIDVLLVILIFLAATTTFSKFTQLDINLPQAQTGAPQTDMTHLSISRDGIYTLEDRLLSGGSTQDITQALAALMHDQPVPALVINADAQASHESVIRAMEAAGLAGIKNIHFATQATP